MSEVRRVGEEASKVQQLRIENGFVDAYLSGAHILDIGYRGYIQDVVPIVPQAIGIELDYPGYDGRTLPFPEGSQDAVFASHCLEHIPDFVQAFRDWHRVLKVGGFLVIMVPHQFLYEKRTTLPSRYNGDHQRFYTPASLMGDVERALPPNSYRLRHLADNDRDFEYDIPPERHSGGCYEIELVIEKIAAPSWGLDMEPWQVTAKLPAEDLTGGNAEAQALRNRRGGVPRISILESSPWDLALYEFGEPQPARRRILAMQLGHFGDFIIGLPALRQLRSLYAGDHIRLVVSSWNRSAAERSGVADEVVLYDLFPENARGWDGKPVQDEQEFARVASGPFDIAVDLRLDEDTRHLLKQVDAHTRCGIGTRQNFPYLDVVLPFDHAARWIRNVDRFTDLALGPDRFHSRMPIKKVVQHQTDFRATDMHVIYGPYLRLPMGQFQAIFQLELAGLPFGMGKLRLHLDVAQSGSAVLAERTLTAAEIMAAPRGEIVLDFENVDDDSATIEFRVHIANKPFRAVLSFNGVRVAYLGSKSKPRLRRANLHIGEQLSLLVQLMADRTRTEPFTAIRATTPPAALARSVPAGRHTVMIAPVSNSDLRDWPVEHYVALVRMLVQELDCTIHLLGSRTQSGTLAHIAQSSGVGHRVVNLAGQTAWADLPAVLQTADLVVCNNSGIAHLAASVGARTLAIYSASHQPQEWGPRGARSRALMAVLPCSPCGYDRLADCPNDHACMRGLRPDDVFDVAAGWLRE